MNKKGFIIAIDGYSSCGKSTLAKAIAEKLGFKYIDSGAMYRAVAYFALKNNYVDSNDKVDVYKLLENLNKINIDFVYDVKTKRSITLLNGEDIEEYIRNEKIAKLASELSKIKEVREKMVELQRKIAKNNNVVMDGRDIGTVVFPEADLKIFMTADLNVRANRRYVELREKGINVSLEEVKEMMIKRDKEDETRDISPLIKASDAIILDNTHMSPEEQLKWFINKYEEIKNTKSHEK